MYSSEQETIQACDNGLLTFVVSWSSCSVWLWCRSPGVRLGEIHQVTVIYKEDGHHAVPSSTSGWPSDPFLGRRMDL